jgi:hypothetical protein
MKKVLFLCCFFIACTVCGAQGNFPKQFMGHWEGEVLWYQQGKKEPQKIKMQLIVQPTDTANQYTWQIIYGENNKDNRPYILKPVDTANGHWQVDERNGIILDQYWLANKFSSAFTVANSTIVDSYWIEGNRLHVEFFNVSAKAVNKTGGTSADIPPVDSYAVKSYQKAVLKKKKTKR